ncbi:MAG: serine protease [Pseudomonadota bacterium]
MIWRLAVALAALWPLAAMAALDGATREAAAQSVVQIRALDCVGDDKAATGFVYGDATQIVTAFHVVAGCRRLNVYFEKFGGQVVGATVDRTLAEADLALLRIDQGPAPALRRADRAARTDDRLEALGYSLGVRSMSNTPLTVRYGDDRLGSILPPGVSRQLRSSTSIDLNLSILRLDGHLLPGLSGAPVLSVDGAVVGVGGGGLKSGAASISYAIPAAALDRLMASAERDQGGGARSEALFATVLPSDSGGGGGQRLTCAGLEFVETGTRSFEELALATDDFASLQQLLALADLDDDVLAGFRYRIFTPVAGGAAIAAPDWMDVRSYGDHCRAVGADGILRVEFAGAAVASLQQMQQVSVAFEDGFVARSGRYWQPDPTTSYVGPITRFDGMLANRKTLVGFDQQGGTALAFETLLNLRGEFTGVIAVSEWWDVNIVTYCGAASYDPQCAELETYLNGVAQAVLGVHLSTFPII